MDEPNVRTPKVVAEGLLFPEGPVAMADGSVLVVEIARGTVSRVTPDGAVTVVADLGGGPNGAAIGADGALYVTNNGGCFDFHDLGGLLFPGSPPPDSWPGHGSLQRVDLATGEATTLYTECNGHPLRAPNDLVIDAGGGIWFTDHGVRQARTSDRSGVYYAEPDGSAITEVAFPLDAPNGIGLSPAGDALYVAETHTGRLYTWSVDGPGAVSGPSMFGPAGGKLLADPPAALFDSMAVDGEGWVCVATLGATPGITSVSPDGSTVELLAMPDPLTTNLAFGADGTTAYITLSGTGKLVTVDWPRPGGQLAFSA